MFVRSGPSVCVHEVSVYCVCNMLASSCLFYGPLAFICWFCFLFTIQHYLNRLVGNELQNETESFYFYFEFIGLLLLALDSNYDSYPAFGTVGLVAF